MSRKRSLMFVLGTLALIAGCQPAAESAEQAEQRMAGEAASARTAIEAANAEFVMHFNAGHGDSAAAQFTERGSMMPPNMATASGRAAVAELMNGMGALKPTLTLTVGSVVANGPLAVELGTYSLSMTPPGATAPVTDTGKFIVRWQKVGDRWMKAADIWNSDLPVIPEPPKKN